MARSEVKGPWFVAMRAWLDANASDGTAARVIQRIPVEHRRAVREPLPSEWYPEEALASALAAVDAEITKGDREAFLGVMEACTEIGLSRFFRVLLRLSTPAFVLRRVPTMWRQIRRGAGEVEVAERGSVVELRYRAFPWFEDARYELLTLGSVRALMKTCTGTSPSIDVAHRAPDALTLHISP